MPGFVGIDVSKKRLDVVTLPGGEIQSFPNSPDGIGSLRDVLIVLRPELVVMEATGGYEREVAVALVLSGLPVAVVNPRQVRDFAKAIGTLAKTDNVDAGVIALFGERLRPEPRGVAPAEIQELDALVTRRSQLIEMITAEKNRHGVAPRPMRAGIQAHIRWMELQLKDIELDLERIIQASPIWRSKEELFTSIPGLGSTTARTLIARLPELGIVSTKRLASLVGVAPFARDSGTFRGKRCIWGGRADVRAALYMATLSSIRWNPITKAHYDQLRARGKPFKVAMVACMRKLLGVLDAMVRHNRHWSLELGQTALPQHSC